MTEPDPPLLEFPAPATVLTLFRPAIGEADPMTGLLQGLPFLPPIPPEPPDPAINPRVTVDYPAATALDSIEVGIEALQTAFTAVGDTMLVLAYGQGCQVASRWLKELAEEPGAPPTTDVTFVLVGNPLRAGTGFMVGRPEVGSTRLQKGTATPTDTGYPVFDIARRYDGMADFPNNRRHWRAVTNANAGKNTTHRHYENVALNDATHTVWTVDTTTYILTAEPNLPMLPPLWRDSNPERYEELREDIESAYERPEEDDPLLGGTLVPPVSPFTRLLRLAGKRIGL